MEKVFYFNFAFICLVATCYIYTVCHAVVDELPDCNAERKTTGFYGNNENNIWKRELVIVGTVDGRISALDPTEDGRLVWSQDTDPGALLSSSISNLELSSRGKVVQIIPSLDGNLCIFNGKGLETIPVSPDALLQHSFKFGDENVITGGKETSAYGINLYTGKLHYTCGISGCSSTGDGVTATEDILLVKRHTQTLHSIDTRTGAEKWNFSVGELQASLVGGMEKGCRATFQLDGMDDIYVEDALDGIQDSLQLKVLTLEGIVAAVHNDSGRPMWSHKLDSPIVNLWKITNGAIEDIDLFANDLRTQNGFAPPLFHIGIYNGQPYVQFNTEMIKSIGNSAAHTTGNPFATLRHLQWKPYLVTANSRTPRIHVGNHEESSDLLHSGNKAIAKAKNPVTTALILKSDQSEYPYDSGYYLLQSKETELLQGDNTSQCRANHTEKQENCIVYTFWDYWREIVAAVCIIWIIAVMIYTNIVWRVCQNTIQECSNPKESQTTHSPALPNCHTVHLTIVEKPALERKSVEYTSRFLTDFDLVQCLGRGGFGVVYEARNKIDDCSYAVKRISLPNREEAREKVRREVKALATLDHVGIVRYFHTWLESPPSGWQEKEDKIWECSNTHSVSHTSASPVIQFQKPVNPLKAEEDNSGSFGFLLSEQHENNSYMFNKDKYVKDAESECSLEIVFQDPKKEREFEFSQLIRTVSDTSSSKNKNTYESVPFEQYKKLEKSALSTRFQDSGCGDHIETSEMISSCSDNSKTAEKEIQSNVAKCPYRPSTLDINISTCTSAPKMYLYIQMQLCQKETLKDWLNNNPKRDREQALDIFYQIASAVEYVHEHGLMHRDLKPSNIFFSLDGLVKVGDFGLVTAMAENELHTPASGLSKKDEGHTTYHTHNVGTQLYMSPEQIFGQAYSHKVDIFSLGLIFFELIVPLSTDMERVQTLLAVKEQRFPKSFKENNPEECALVQQLVSINPEERPSASAIISHHLFNDIPSYSHVSPQRTRHRTFSSNRLSTGSDIELPAYNNIDAINGFA